MSDILRKGRYFMNGKKHQIIAFALAAVISVGMSAQTASAATDTALEVTRTSTVQDGYVTDLSSLEREYLSLHTVSNKNTYSYNRMSVRVGTVTLSVQGFFAAGSYYIPFRTAASAIGAGYSYNSGTKTSTMTVGSLKLTATSGNYVIYAGERPLFSQSPTVIMNDGRMYIPADVFAKAVGMTLSTASGSISFTGNLSPLGKATYTSDEVFWLARIIHAESRGEPLLGQIAVGNVVLNRVRSSEYPNTIYSVIFDRKYGVQFSPILDGSIYNTPSYNSTLAAKICLEGFDISGGALFFLHPAMSTSSWIPKNRPYSFSIGKHDFYR